VKSSSGSFPLCSFGILLLVLLNCSCADSDSRELYILKLEGTGWKITGTPDLDSLNGNKLDRQHVVDHGIIQKPDGIWLIWAYIRGTRPGRLLFGWEGESLQLGPWKPMGVVARADSSWGEN
jgi:hypothetical protein